MRSASRLVEGEIGRVDVGVFGRPSSTWKRESRPIYPLRQGILSKIHPHSVCSSLFLGGSISRLVRTAEMASLDLLMN